MSDEIPDWLAKAGMPEESSGPPFGRRYSVWDLGPLSDPDPEVIDRFRAIEKELMEMSENTRYRRYHEMEESHGDDPDLMREALITETYNHSERIKRLQTVLHQIRYGSDF